MTSQATESNLNIKSSNECGNPISSKLILNSSQNFIRSSNEEKFIQPLPVLNSRIQRSSCKIIPLYTISNIEESVEHYPQIDIGRYEIFNIFPLNNEKNEIIEYICHLWRRIDWDLDELMPANKKKPESPKISKKLSKITRCPKIDDGRFYYCLPKCFSNKKSKYDPYNLKVVTAEEAKESKIFWTVSASSVTTVYQNKTNANENDISKITLSSCDSTPVPQWLHEKILFHQLTNMDTFNYFRYWKAFTIWRNNISTSKMVKHRNHLTLNLSRLDPIFQDCVNKVHRLSEDLLDRISINSVASEDNLTMFFIDPSQTYNLTEFYQNQLNQVSLFKENLHKVYSTMLESVLKTCQNYTDKINLSSYLEEISKERNLDSSSSSFMHTERIRIRKSMKYIKEFLKLLDCQLVQLCHRILKRNISKFCQFIVESINYDENSDENKKSKIKNIPIFIVDANLSFLSNEEVEKLSDENDTKLSSRLYFSADNQLQSSYKSRSLIKIENIDTSSYSSILSTETPRSNLTTPEDKIDESRNTIYPIMLPERLIINEEFYNEFYSFKIPGISVQISLSPILENILFCLKDLIEEAELTICSVETFSSQKCLELFKEDQYNKINPKLSLINETLTEREPVLISPSIKLMLDTDMEYCENVKTILKMSTNSLIDLVHYLPILNFCCFYVDEALKEYERISEPEFQWDIDEFQKHLVQNTEKILDINKTIKTKRIGFISLQTKNLTQDSKPYIEKVIGIVNEKLSKEATAHNDEFINLMRTANKTLDTDPKTVEEFVEHLEFINKINAEMLSMDKEARSINQMFTIITNFKVPVALEQLALYKTLNHAIQKLKNNVVYYEAKKDENIRKFSADLEKKIEEIRIRIMEIKGKARNSSFLDQNQTQSIILDQLGTLKNEVRDLGNKIRNYSNYQERFGSSLSKAASKSRQRQQFDLFTGNTASNLQEDVEEVERDISMRYLLWETKSEWERWYENFIVKKLDETEVNTVRQTVSRTNHTVGVLEKSLPQNEILPAVKALVNECKSSLPVIIALRNPNLQLRHWHKIEKMIGLSLTKNKNFTIGELISSKILQYKQIIMEISEFANNEMTLEHMLTKVKDVYAVLEFRLVSHSNRDTWIITGVDDINVDLEESHMTISTIKGSKYVDHIRTQVEDWERKLSHTAKVLDEWINCQKHWLYLEQIFGTVDIQRQLPNEGRLFHEVDCEWRSLMQQTKEKPLVLKCCTKQGVLQILQTCNSKLEKIQKSLEDYLEMKRIIFPRLFFLSNDELLEILSRAQDPENVQRHLTKLFANVHKLQIDSSSSQSHSITHVVSYEGEAFPLPRNIRVRGLAEQWLATLEQGIFEGVKRQIKRCLIEMEQKQFVDWALNNFGQSILVSTQVKFSQNVSRALKGTPDPESTGLLTIPSIISDLIQNLELLAVTVSEDIVSYKRFALEAMIVIKVHNRDSAQSLLENDVKSELDFEWKKQIRYLWNEFSSQCQVTQVDSYFEYGNEYLGCSPRLVITPLTDRCYMTMTGALNFNLGGCAKGPAGTGKTETIKDLSKVMGRQCVVFNCSDKLDNSTVAKLLSGVIQVGSWCCFDEFNRMNLEVLSVIAAQIYSIKAAKDSRFERFIFENKEIKLNPYCGIFITMNPSYAGRVELPDNLSFLFRPVAMMVPDYVLICEVILFSEGFITAKVLSSKITNLYRLCNDQLSSQQHYDFGLRSIKSVLILMGHLRLERVLISETVQLNVNEELNILIQAIKISNEPRLITDDLPLFKSIMGDLFGDFDEVLENDKLLERSIELSYKELGYEVWPDQIEKIKYLNSQLKSRHGVMLLGPSASGKTVIRSILQKALTFLPLINLSKEKDDCEKDEMSRNIQQPSSNRRAKIDVQVVNPKALSINHLYGYVNPNSLEWIEGIIPMVTKKMISFSNKNQNVLNDQLSTDNFEKENSNQNDFQTLLNNEQGQRKERRRSSLLNMEIIKKLSVSQRFSVESQDVLQDSVKNQFTKDAKIVSHRSKKNWQWIVLDGPINSAWVENLNTVLDDSQILCLANGERINIPASLKFLFEVDDLKNSSPATVSRCAMIYVGKQSIHWKIQVKSWMKNQLPKSFPESGKEFLYKLFEKSIKPGMKFLSKCSKIQIIPNTSKQSQLFTLCCILEALILYLSANGGFDNLSLDILDASKADSSRKLNESTTRFQDTKQFPFIQKENSKVSFLQKNPKELNNLLGKLYVFAYTWSFGAAFARQEDLEIETNIDTASGKKSGFSIYEAADEFDLFVKSLFDNNSETGIRLPLDNKTIYSYFVDMDKGIFQPWDILVPSIKNLIDASGILSFSSGINANNQNRVNEIIVSLDSIRYSFLSALLMLNNHPVLLAGDSGIGKSILINDILKQICRKNGSSTSNSDSILGKIFMYNDKNQNLLSSIQNLSKFSNSADIEDDIIEKSLYVPMETDTYIYSSIKFNSQTSINKALQHMTSKMVKRGQDIIGPPKNKKMLLFIDDLNVPTIDEFGSQSTLEMVRQWIELNGFFDNTSLQWTYVTDCSLIVACSPNIQSPISERLTKHFCVLTLPQPSSNAFQRIFQVKIGRYFHQKDFSIEIKAHLTSIVDIPISVYFKTINQYKTSPLKSHYIFNLRVLHKIINGLLNADDKLVVNKEDIGKYVAHEIIREIHDRLISDPDREIFFKILSDELHMSLKLNWAHDELGKCDIMFGKFFPLKGSSSSTKVYQQITDVEKLIRFFESSINTFDHEHLNTNNFIFFKQSIQHMIRFMRILNQSSGHMLMIGVEGCGKYSNVKISSAIIGCDIFRLNMTSDYNNISFRGDIKKVIQKSILQNRPCVVYLSDMDDLVNDSFMDDLCNLINSGHIPDLYENDELENILSNLKPEDLGSESVSDPNDVYFLLIEKIQKYLHVCIGLSPNNSLYRSRLRNNPSLINCCTIDWYMDWSTESLMSVAHFRIEEIINNFKIEIETSKEDTMHNLTEASIFIYRTAIEVGNQFQMELRRPYFLSSGDFIEFLNNFFDILQNDYVKNNSNRSRLSKGLNQLMETRSLITKMKEDLIELTPKIKEKSEETERLLQKVKDDKKLVSEIEEIVKDEEEVIKMETEAVEDYSLKCEEDLLSVTPVLEASIKALDSLNKASISEVRVYRNPPRLVEIVMNAVCVLLSVTPSWANAKLLLGDANFLQKLLNYEKDAINKKMYKDLQQYTGQKDFNPESVGYVSLACRSICQWVLAIEHYHSVNNMIIPKRKTVNEAKKALEISKQKLEWKQNQLKKVEDHIKNLDNKYQNSVKEQKQLKERVRLTNERLYRAAALIEAIQSEKDRWHSSIKDCDNATKNIIGSCMTSAAYATFTGPWTLVYREMAKKKWIDILGNKSIPIEDNYKFVEFEFSAYTILNWHNNGLPRDSSMAENVAIIEKSKKWPLLIDPQKQGKRFLQTTFKDSFRVISCKQKDYIVMLERAIRVGDTICLEDIETQIDPVLGPLLRKEFFRRGNVTMIKLGENELEYSPSFKLYLMSSLSNPQLVSSVNRLVTIINFTVNLVGLEEQLLSLIVSKEKPEIENERNRFLRTYANDLESLRNLEDKTLGLLQDSTDKIVNDSELAQNLEKSKITALDIKKRLEETIQAEKQLQLARKFYLPLAIRGAQIYFVLADLGVVNYMYQYSLAWFQNLFTECVDEINKEIGENVSISPETKLQKIIDSVTYQSYHMASHGLFSIHRPLFAFMLSTSIMRYSLEESDNRIGQKQWATFIKLHTTSSVYGENLKAFDSTGQIIKQPDNIEWLTLEVWNKCKFLEIELKDKFSGLCNSFKLTPETWIKWNLSENPFDMSSYNFKEFSVKYLNSFEKLILISILCSYKLIDSARLYVKLVLGEKFSTLLESNLLNLFTESHAKIPIVFILGANSDPINHVMKLVMELRGNTSNLDIVSMGRGQATKAESLIQKTHIHKGRWIFLQNCDLMISWMPSLQKLIENLQISKQDNDANFKLILSTHPHSDFPIGILQNSLKIAIESPIGIKNQLLKSFALDGTGNVTETIYNNQSEQIRKMIFNLCLFNAVVLERRNYGSLGFSLPYDFNDSDLEISIKQIPTFLTNNEVQWNALHNVIGNINYGGRITDNLDRRCLMHLLQNYASENNNGSGIEMFVKSPKVLIGHLTDFQSINSFIHSNDCAVEKLENLLGLGDNAEIVRLENQSKSFIIDIIVQQSKHHEDQKTTDSNSALDMLKVISNKIPRSVEQHIIDTYGKDFLKDFEQVIPLFGKLDEAIKNDFLRFNKYSNKEMIIRFFDSPFHNVLEQEIKQYNYLLIRIHKDIKLLVGYLSGNKNITESLETVLDYISINLVPPSWGLLSIGKSLSEWSSNVRIRIDFIGFWCYSILREYHKYLELVYSTASSICAMHNPGNDKINILNYEKESLEQIQNENLFQKLRKNIVCYWLPGFFSPQSLITAVMQNEARIIHESVDMLTVSLEVLPRNLLGDLEEYFAQSELFDVTKTYSTSEIISKTMYNPDHGVLVFGLYLDNALWNLENSSLAINPIHRRYCKLPIIHLMAVISEKNKKEDSYTFLCPLYRTPSRFGILSSSGKSSNFLCFLTLKSDRIPSFWILRGTAALLQCEID